MSLNVCVYINIFIFFSSRESGDGRTEIPEEPPFEGKGDLFSATY